MKRERVKPVLKALLERLEQQEAALRRLEWPLGNDDGVCGVCYKYESAGHASDCLLTALLEPREEMFSEAEPHNEGVFGTVPWTMRVSWRQRDDVGH